MTTVNIHEAEKNWSKLIHEAASGKPVVITEAGKPLVKVVPYDTPTRTQLLGCMRERAVMEKGADVKAIGREEILAMFEGRQ